MKEGRRSWEGKKDKVARGKKAEGKVPPYSFMVQMRMKDGGKKEELGGTREEGRRSQRGGERNGKREDKE